ncbi:MAG TPA: hypothetical protein VIX84_10290 [Acidimicrobiales bacterium]
MAVAFHPGMASVPDSDDTWTVPGVYLLTEGPDGRVAVPHLELILFDDGISLDKSDGEPVWSAAWSDLAELSTVERSELPGGGTGVVILVVERGEGRRHEFVLPTDDPDSAESSVHDRARAHGLRTNPRPRRVSRLLTLAVLLTAAATVSALLLSAEHVIHF